MDRQEELELAEPATRDKGFTLIELLIVIVILGILSAIVVLSVSAITNRGQTNACKADEQTLRIAYEAAVANGVTASGVTEANLLSGGYLNAVSTLHDMAWDAVAVPPRMTFTPVAPCT